MDKPTKTSKRGFSSRHAATHKTPDQAEPDCCRLGRTVHGSAWACAGGSDGLQGRFDLGITETNAGHFGWPQAPTESYRAALSAITTGNDGDTVLRGAGRPSDRSSKPRSGRDRVKTIYLWAVLLLAVILFLMAASWVLQ